MKQSRYETKSVSPPPPLCKGCIVFVVAFSVVLALFAMLPARADLRILSSPGGMVDAYLAAFARVRQSGERVVIDGPCLSACHAARWIDPNGHTWRAPEATRIVTASYPSRVRGWIKKRGGLTQKLIYLRGKELAALYPRC